jgi:protein TonB
VLFHGAILALIVGGVVGGSVRLRAAGDGYGAAGGGGGGGGGRRVSYIELPSVGAPAAAETAAPEPAPPVETPPVEDAPVVPVPPPSETAVASAAAPAEARADTGSGTGAGTGAGVGPGSGGGSGGGTGGGEGPGTGLGVGPGTGGDSTDIIPAQLRNLVPPIAERPPRELRGQRINVTFWVSADGLVDRFTLDPEIADRDFREKFSEIVMKTRFRPARTRAGIAVPSIYEMAITLNTGS